MQSWRERLNDLLEGKIKLFEEDYVPGEVCRYKKNGVWIKAKIDMKEKVVYGLDGQVLRRCN